MGSKRYEDLVERLRDEGLSDLADDFEEFSATSLRKKAAGFDEVARERDDLKKQLQEMVELPKREAAFRSAGVDFDSLRPAEKKLLRELKPEGDISDEWVAKVISDFGLPVSDTSEAVSERSEAEKVTDTALSAPQGRTTGTTITPAVAREWSSDKMIEFSEKHPEAWEQLKRGESVTGIQA